MNYTLIAEGDDISTLDQAEDMLKEYDYGEVRVYVSGVPTQESIDQLDQQLVADGVTLTGPVVFDPDIGAIVIPFQKRMSPLQVIGFSVGGIVVLASMVFAWQLTQSLGGGGLAGVWILLGALGLVLFIKSSEGHAVARAGYEAARHVGKVYVARRAFLTPTETKAVAGRTRTQIQSEAEAESERLSRTVGPSATGYSGGRPYSYAGQQDIDEG